MIMIAARRCVQKVSLCVLLFCLFSFLAYGMLP